MVRPFLAMALLPLVLEWSVVDRLTGPASVQDEPRAQPALVRLGVPGACPRDARWRLDGRPVDPRPAGRCAFHLPVAAGEHRVELAVGDRRVEERVDVRDHLVVSVGDSVASGEGNPDGLGPRWLERRCHRSLRSGPAQAALAFERGDRRSAVTFVPLGCSGATIDQGLVGPYDGIQPDRRRGPLPPQLDRLRDLAPGRDVGAVLVSVGANDVHFGALLRFCMAVSACDRRRFDPESPTREARDPAAPTAAAVVRAALGRLREGYDRIAPRLRERVAPDRVVIVEYFDPLRDEQGDTCAAALPGVSREESAWARRELLAPLNAEVHAAAARHGWRVVGGVATAFSRHGICAPRRARWVRRPEESALRQLALTGTMHPNGPGHRATAALIGPVLAGALAADPTAGSSEVAELGDDGGDVSWFWLPVAGLAGALAALLAGTLVRRVRRRP